VPQVPQIGSGFFSNIGAGVSGFFQGEADLAKAQGDKLEGQAYTEAAGLADQNAAFTVQSEALQEFQANRSAEKTIGGIQADVATNGFTQGGSALDILRDSANQNALQAATLKQQGLITEAGYQEQAASYRIMADAASKAASAEQTAATGSFIGAGISVASAAFSLLPVPAA
jgi:hypothetical protein